jgi:hypothetical protein
MRKKIVTVLGALLVAGSAVQAATAAERHIYRSSVAASQQFRHANNSVDGAMHTFCSQEPGNPYDKETDYMGWSAWRQHGAWDSRNECP